MNIYRTKKAFASLALVGIVVAGGFTPSSARACSCMMPVPPVDAVDQSDAVFIGKVLDIASGPREYGNTVALEAEISWKGSVEKTVEVVTAQDSAACGVYFQVGKTYIVYAHQNADDGSLGVNSCSRTHEIAGAIEFDEDVVALGSGTPVTTSAQPVAGEVSNQGALTMLVVGLLGVIGGFTAFKLRSRKA